jgi:hypothetical protein
MTDTERAMLDECLAADHGLNDWEIGFLESLDKIRSFSLSEKQMACLVKINSKVLDLGV